LGLHGFFRQIICAPYCGKLATVDRSSHYTNDNQYDVREESGDFAKRGFLELLSQAYSKGAYLTIRFILELAAVAMGHCFGG
jgi:hypothetical protein